MKIKIKKGGIIESLEYKQVFSPVQYAKKTRQTAGVQSKRVSDIVFNPQKCAYNVRLIYPDGDIHNHNQKPLLLKGNYPTYEAAVDAEIAYFESKM